MEHRYTRQMALPGWGIDGQKKLSEARVLIVGAGGLGANVLMQLAAAGVGKISIIDHDDVSLSNLHRQFVFEEEDIGLNKATAAARRVERRNSSVVATPYSLRLDAELAESLFSEHDLVLDCTDDASTRWMISDAAFLADIPCVFAAMYRYEAQVTVFKRSSEGKAWSLRSLFPEFLHSPIPDCNSNGTAGPIAATIAGYQAMEALKLLLGIGDPLAGRMLTVNMASGSMLEAKWPAVSIAGSGLPGDWETFRAIHRQDLNEDDIEVDVEAVETSGYFVVDVRDEFEIDGDPVGLHMPMHQVRERFSALPVGAPVLFVCDKGMRSTVVARMLRKESGFKLAYSLRGGLNRLA